MYTMYNTLLTDRLHHSLTPSLTNSFTHSSQSMTCRLTDVELRRFLKVIIRKMRTGVAAGAGVAGEVKIGARSSQEMRALSPTDLGQVS